MGKNVHLRMANRIKVCREYADLWQSYFQFFSDIGEDSQITEEMESDFESIMNILALNHYKFQELCGEFMKDSDTVVNILCETVSLEAIRLMPDATRSKLLVDWHRTFIDMNKAMGRMLAKLTPKQLEQMQATEGAAQPAA